MVSAISAFFSGVAFQYPMFLGSNEEILNLFPCWTGKPLAFASYGPADLPKRNYLISV
jgi:hypothetical protein